MMYILRSKIINFDFVAIEITWRYEASKFEFDFKLKLNPLFNERLIH